MAAADSRFEPTEEFFNTLPTEPGVYIMKGDADTVVYVGKAIKHSKPGEAIFSPRG